MQLRNPVTPLWICLAVTFILLSRACSSSLGREDDDDDYNDDKRFKNYGVLLDAGSSSSKLNVYRWVPPVSGEMLPNISLVAHDKFDMPFSAFKNDSSGLRSYLSNIIHKAQKYVPLKKQSRTPLFVLATAGLRFLSAQDARDFLEDTRKELMDRDLNPFWYDPRKTSILSGEEEGVYSWISANYLLDFFDDNRPDSETVGVLELGGGSTQITFLPHGPLFSEEYQVTVAGRSYQLYVQSYLMYGANAIKVKIAYLLSQQNPKQNVLDNPCMLRGDSTNSTKLEDGRILTERGTGNPEQCLSLLREILIPKTGMDCQPKPCAIGSVHQPSVGNTTFYATQAFTHAPQALKVVGPDKLLHLDKLERAALKFCTHTLDQAVTLYGMQRSFASSNCLQGLYIPTLLTTSYGFRRDTTNIIITSTIGGSRIDWSLGAMLVELSNLFGSKWPRYAVKCWPHKDWFTSRSSSITSRQQWASSLLLVLIIILFNHLSL